MRARGALVAILFAGVALPFNTPFALLALIPIYLARSRTMTIAGTVGVGVAMAVHDLIWATDEPFSAYAASLALCVMAGALGMYSGVRRAAAARERELLAEAAAAEERLRIARELHDAVGHDVSLMVVQAQALGATDERIREHTDAIADLGRRTMADLHRTLRVLRGDEDAERAPGAGLADLDELVDVARASGLPITVVVDGAPRELAPLVDQSAYRIVQEAVTNVVKHADRAPTTITLGYGDRALELTIADEGEVSISTTAATASSGCASAPSCSAARSRRARATGRASKCKRSCRTDEPAARGDRRRPAADARGLQDRARGDREHRGRRRGGRRGGGDPRRRDLCARRVLMDIRMPRVDGIEATRRLPRHRVLILTTFGLDEYIVEALRAGASGFLLKDAPAAGAGRARCERWRRATPCCRPGHAEAARPESPHRLPAPVTRDDGALAELTERELEVLRLMAGGLSNAEIAAALVVSEATVKSHVSNLLGKLGLRDRVQAVILAYETGLVGPR